MIKPVESFTALLLLACSVAAQSLDGMSAVGGQSPSPVFSAGPTAIYGPQTQNGASTIPGYSLRVSTVVNAGSAGKTQIRVTLGNYTGGGGTMSANHVSIGINAKI